MWVITSFTPDTPDPKKPTAVRGVGMASFDDGAGNIFTAPSFRLDTNDAQSIAVFVEDCKKALAEYQAQQSGTAAIVGKIAAELNK